MNVFRGRKIRMLPTHQQSRFLHKIAWGYRKTWNWALHLQMESFKRYGKLKNWNEVHRIFTKYLNTSYGEELRLLPIQFIHVAIDDLHKAYEKFFKIQQYLKEKKQMLLYKKSYEIT